MNLDLPTREDYQNLSEQVSEIKEMLRLALEYSGAPSVVTVRFIAKVENLSVSGIRKQPWLLPNYGVSEYQGDTRWRYETFLKWRSIDPQTRYMGWIQKCEQDRLAHASR